MSIDDYYDGHDEWLEGIYRDFAKETLAGDTDLYAEVVAKFKKERLQSYFLENPKTAGRAMWALARARQFYPASPDACLAFAVTSAEVGLKMCFIRPILIGLVHDHAIAPVIADLLPQQRNGKFRLLLFTILSQYGGVDLGSYKRETAMKTLWDELQDAHKARNELLHNGTDVTPLSARQGLDVARTIMEILFPTLLQSLGLKLSDDNQTVLRQL